MASSPSDLEHKAREAFIDDHFDLAVDLYSQAIALSPSNPDLFADRAQANLQLQGSVDFGPNINSTSNNNVVVNIFNNLDEPYLLTWNGIQQRKNSWQDVTLGTQCPIAPGKNFTYHFQVKDQIGSYFYYPSTAVHRAVGGFGDLRVNSRPLIPVPYLDPEDEYTIIINDWYTKSHALLKRLLDNGKLFGRPSGVFINGKSGKEAKSIPLFTMISGKTYKYKICNVSMKTTLNFRIQGHQMKLVEIEGSHVVQNVYDSLDIHVGQCFSVLVTANKVPRDYYTVASTRFTKKVLIATGIIGYTNNKVPASFVLPEAPVSWAWSLNQFRTFRWNLTASTARPNPQGSYHYGQINITVLKIRSVRIEVGSCGTL